ncbi:hypothetical protein Pmani_010206 [Petrolisthes manimaculis]|uniref:Uncharacterized protein n=1 Tax=Petrolisthes manimaculis TaxID=1843537 RepID=A0AAE1UC62_9EUCA|nr:hypothetical protein Pmani_010206 [Petrolisthes manimaculis]
MNSEESSDLLSSEAGTTRVETRDIDFSLIHPTHHVPSQDSHPEHHNTATTSTSLGRASGRYYSREIGSDTAAQLKGGRRQIIPIPASPQGVLRAEYHTSPYASPPTPTHLTTTTARSRHRRL